MQQSDEALRTRVRKAWPEPARPPAFGAAWAMAAQRYRGRRHGYGIAAAAAAVAAALIVLVNSDAPVGEHYIEIADLMDSTYWTAPSDTLLPDREFDIYQDLPELFESTEPAEGALL